VFKKIWAVFARDIKVNTREAMPVFILVLPLLLAIGINLITPGINDTTVNVAMVKNESTAQADYFNQFAHVELFDSRQAVENRVMERDSMLGIVQEGGGFVILAQGNESETVVDYTKLIKSLFETGAGLEDANTEIVEFGRTIPPLKKIMVNILLLLNAVLAGMLISLNILEEKSDRTIGAVNVAPISRGAFILGKSLTGVVFALILTIVCIVVTGFYGVNIAQTVLVVLATAVISMMVGFIQGINSSDVMEAAGSVKLMFLPLAGSVAGYQLLSGPWQIFFYWSPFYWAYRANDRILSQNGTWPEMLLCLGAILVICAAIYLILAPRIRKGLQ
jgi:ABC-type Na+ efflux pump permease subunit